MVIAMRLIDADALIEKSLKDANCYMDNNGIKHGYHNVQCLIYDAPTVDAVPRADYEELERHFVNWEPVVRCKDCRHWSEMQNLTGACLRLCAIDGALWMGTDATDFCSFAERRDDE